WWALGTHHFARGSSEPLEPTRSSSVLQEGSTPMCAKPPGISVVGAPPSALRERRPSRPRAPPLAVGARPVYFDARSNRNRASTTKNVPQVPKAAKAVIPISYVVFGRVGLGVAVLDHGAHRSGTMAGR